MKNIMLSLCMALIAANVISPSNAHAVPGGSGGGSDVRFDFQKHAQHAIDEIPRIIKLQHLQTKPLSDALAKARIYISNKKLSDGKGESLQEVVAKNYPKQNKIILSRPLWNAIKSNVRKQALALHEILSLVGLESSGDYKYSQAYYEANAPTVSTKFTDLMKPMVLNELEDPKIRIVIFEDFVSPYVEFHERIALKKIIENYGDRVQITVRNFPITVLHENARITALGAICANSQGQFVPMRRAFLNEMKIAGWNPDILAENRVKEIALSLPALDNAEFNRCLSSPEAQMKLDADIAMVEELKLIGSPAAVVSSKWEAHRIDGARDYEWWSKMIEKMLARKDTLEVQ